MRWLLLVLALSHPLLAAPKRVAVFVALCDNATQGIAPVPAKIGNGDKPDDNLYWGCTEGFASCFRASKAWKLQKKERPEDPRIFERLVYLHESRVLVAGRAAGLGQGASACRNPQGGGGGLRAESENLTKGGKRDFPGGTAMSCTSMRPIFRPKSADR